MAIDLENKKKASELIKNADKLLKNNDHSAALHAVIDALELDPSNLYAQAYRERIKSIMAKAGIEEKPKPAAAVTPEVKPVAEQVPTPSLPVEKIVQEPKPKPEPVKKVEKVVEQPKVEPVKNIEKAVQPQSQPPVQPVAKVEVPPPVPVEKKPEKKAEKEILKELDAENKTGKLRKLAAIMFTDMVSYSTLTQKNENLALQLLDMHQKMVRPLLKKYEGKEIKTVGDAFLVEFVSVLQAARSALEIQKTFDEYNITTVDEHKIQLRIGIHLGDVIYMDNDILGDGVNIASRIQAMTHPGGIYISQDVYNQIRNRDEFVIEYVAEIQLKNILSAIPIYKLLTAREALLKTETETLSFAIEEGKKEAKELKLKEILVAAKQKVSKGQDVEAWIDATRLLMMDPHHAEAKLIESQILARRQQESAKKVEQAKLKGRDDIKNVYKEVLRQALVEGDLTGDERDIFLAWRREVNIEDSIHDTLLKELKMQKN